MQGLGMGGGRFEVHLQTAGQPMQTGLEEVTFLVASHALAAAQAAQTQLQSERDRMGWQICELEKLAPGAQEWDALNTEHSRLSHAQALLDAARDVANALQEAEPSAADALHAALTQLRQHEPHEPSFGALANLLESSLTQLQDVVHSLKSYLRKTEPDPQRLEWLDERMALWLSLARRYRRAPQELAATLQAWQGELVRLDAAADLEAGSKVCSLPFLLR